MLRGLRCGIEWLSGPIAPPCRCLSPNLLLVGLTSRAHVCLAPALKAMAVLPAPRLTERRLVSISAGAGARVRTRRAGTSDTVVELGGQGPLVLSPRSEVSSSPSCPTLLRPQHLTVASSCREKQPRTTYWLSEDCWGESFTQGFKVGLNPLG